MPPLTNPRATANAPPTHSHATRWPTATPPQVLVSVTIREPRIPIYSNVTAQPFKDAAEVAALLPRQLVEPVQWEGTIRALLAAGAPEGRGELAGPYRHRYGYVFDTWGYQRRKTNTLPPRASPCRPGPLPSHSLPALPASAAGKNQLHELGPGQQIKAMVRRIDNTAWSAFKNVAA